MKSVLIFAFFLYCDALDCGIHLTKDENLLQTINKCVRNNKTLEELWDLSTLSNEDDSSSSDSSEHHPVDGKMIQNFRNRRDIDHNDTSESQQSDSNESKLTENCIFHCIFENLEMVDSNGYPEHEKMLEAMLKNAQNRELRDFLQDTIDDCFQELERMQNLDSCVYSMKLVNCIADKGKSNCTDWPIGDLPFQN